MELKKWVSLDLSRNVIWDKWARNIAEKMRFQEGMSKSYGNFVGINENPNEILCKIMSISVDLMIKYYELLTNKI